MGNNQIERECSCAEIDDAYRSEHKIAKGFCGICETLAVDIIWFKNIQQNFKQVTEKMKKASLPATIDPENAREEWRKAAIALTEAGNAAGLASTKIGSGGLAAFPAWRLKLAIKYFKAQAKLR